MNKNSLSAMVWILCSVITGISVIYGNLIVAILGLTIPYYLAKHITEK